MDAFFTFVDRFNGFLWTYVVIVLLIFCAIYFTVRLKGVQFRMLRDSWKVLADRPVAGDSDSPSGKKDQSRTRRKDGIGSFQAFAISLSSRVGTGNLAGVASAIFIGGPGAVFWMWVMALLGAATAFMEATLAQLYKRKGKNSFFGGPAYYMQHGLHSRSMGIIFAIMLIVTFGMANQVVQSNTLCEALGDALSVNRVWIGAVLAVATLLIIFGGVRRISSFASIVVPIMAIGYLLISLVVIALNIKEIPSMLAMIVKNAFGFEQAAGAMFGTAVMQGIKRGLFSNEAGEGSAPNAAAIASTSHPVKQGMLQALGVFTDTIIICTCTAFIILLSGLHDKGLDGILLTKNALVSHLGPVGGHFITLAIFLFAFSTLIGNYLYAETNLRFITSRRWVVPAFRIVTALTVIAGSALTLQEAWSIVDLTMGLMTIVNLIAVFLLAPKVFALLKDYVAQKQAGTDPVFHRSAMPEDAADIECWE